jgi:hypothetical protein
MRLPIFLAALSATAQPTPNRLPEHLRCQISGEAGCSNDICVGNGHRDDKISMVIDTAKRTIAVNNIGGRIEGAEPLDFGQRRSVFWHPRLIGLTTIHVRPEASHDKNGAPYTVVELDNGSDEVEFECREG